MIRTWECDRYFLGLQISKKNPWQQDIRRTYG
jgi:hypothetical protein